MIKNAGPAKTSAQLAEEAEKKGEILLIKDGNGFDHMVMNLDHSKWCPTTGIIEIYPLKTGRGLNGAKRHDNEVSFSQVRDRNNGCVIGIMNGSDHKTGQLKFERIKFTDAQFFDLSIPTERRRYICFMNSFFYINSPNKLNGTKTLYDVVDHARNRNDYFVNRRTRKKAAEIAEGLQGEELTETAYLLGFDPKVIAAEELYYEVLKIADSDVKVNGKTGAERFLEAYENDMRHERLVFKKGLATGIIELGPEKGYTFSGNSIGYTEAEVLNYLKNNSGVVMAIDLNSKTKIDHTIQVERFDKAEVKSEEAAMIYNLKKQLAEKEAQLKELSGIAAAEDASAVVSKIDPEYAELLEEAQRIGVKGAHLIGRNDNNIETKKEKLKEKIKKHKQVNNN